MTGTGASRRAVSLEVALSADPAAGGGSGDGDGREAGSAGPGREPAPEEPPAGARSGPGDRSAADAWLPDEAFVARWARCAVDAALADAEPADARLAGDGPLAVELSAHLAGAGESRALNREHRGRDAPTNVLSFPSGLPALPMSGDGPDGGADDPAHGAPTLVALGDLVLCPEVIRREAAEQDKEARAHWAHLVVHGTLHLLGLDHEDAAGAARMEAVEVRLLSAGGWPDPYRATPDEAAR